MDALKAGYHKAQETVQGKKAETDINKATDPSSKPSDRLEHAEDAAKAAQKKDEHGLKAECKANDNKSCSHCS